MSAEALRELRDLIERAIHDLVNGWPEAAADALGRARRILQSESPPPIGDDMTDTKSPQTQTPVTDRWPKSDIGRKSESSRYGEPSTNPYPVSPAQINDEKPTA